MHELPELHLIGGVSEALAQLRSAAAFQLVAQHRDAELDAARKEADDWRKVALAVAAEANFALRNIRTHIEHANRFYRGDDHAA